MDVESGARMLLVLVVIGVALVIAIGVVYSNEITNRNQLYSQFATSNSNNAILANYSTNAANISNTAGSNSNYAYYILFAALIIAVVIGALVSAANRQQG